MDTIDLRSDTITQPTAQMRTAMAAAAVGDDVYGEDATVNRLQDRTAELLGKEAALYVPTGCMGNLIALWLHAGRGNEVLAHEDSHVIHYEMATGASIAGCQLVPVRGERGILRPAALESRVRSPIYYNARTKAVEVENTGNLAGGTCYTEQELTDLAEWARQHGLAVHMDGARLWNASVALGVSPEALARYADSVMVCFSKGLGAPVGSALAGTKEFVAEARRVRKMLGGGMRQAGIVAAGALYALDHHVAPLAEDHAHARRLAQALTDSPWATVPLAPETNIVFAQVSGGNAEALAVRLAQRGVRCSAMTAERIRFVTHRDVTSSQIDVACEVIRRL